MPSARPRWRRQAGLTFVRSHSFPANGDTHAGRKPNQRRKKRNLGSHGLNGVVEASEAHYGTWDEQHEGGPKADPSRGYRDLFSDRIDAPRALAFGFSHVGQWAVCLNENQAIERPGEGVSLFFTLELTRNSESGSESQ